MKRLFLCLFVFFVFLNVSASPVFSQGGFAACDLCGYCPPNNPPSSWEACRSCIYPNASNNPSEKETLKLSILDEFPLTPKPTPNSELIPPTPYPGRYYTFIGCIRTSQGSFREQGAAGNVIQTLLNIVFSIAGGLAFLFLIYGAFIVLTSQASPERVNYGKRVLIGAIVGIIFTVGAVFLINLLASGILKIPGFGGTP